MARSLTTSHNEKPATSSLFNLFFLLALIWMAFAAVTSGPAIGETPATVEFTVE
ncbi:MAG: hypothetical protein ACI8RZ_006481 [Myxococcota bacterium]|jgi:hypothetical protein